jgi:hypothetical protein
MRHKVTVNRSDHAAWHKSSYSGGGGGECVEVAEGRSVLVRDTQNRELGHLVYPGTEWAGLLWSLRRDQR